jgi:DNA (cytosine-5)-methyltransferase 1
MSKRVIKAADLFCGAGGSSTGLRQACEALGLPLNLIAVNHWDIAISTHTKNHPEAEHLCTDLNSVDPRKIVPGGRLDLLIASPECTFHSNARGGTPINDQSRASAWRVVEWISQIEVDEILIENVPEFRFWGPLIKKTVDRNVALPAPVIPFEKWHEKSRRHGGTLREWKKIYRRLVRDGVTEKSTAKERLTVLVPDPKRRGEIFLAFLKSIESHGYAVDHRILNAADYGDPTSRPRLFIRASRKRKTIAWPEPTHEKVSRMTDNLLLFESSSRKPYRTAREIIDWSIQGESIFTKKKPLVLATIMRIAYGLEKFCGIPFLVKYYGGSFAQSIDEPLPAVTANYEHYGLCQPFIVELRNNLNARSIDEPLSVIAAGGSHHGICQPFIVELRNGQYARSIDAPLSTITTKGMHHGVCRPFLLPYNGNHDGKADSANRGHDIDEPIPTLTTSNRFGLVQPFIIPVNHGKGDLRTHSIDNPMPTITSVDAWAVVNPFLVKYNGTGGAMPIDEPLDTITGKDRFGLVDGSVELEGNQYILDIRFRMLQPHELAAAMSFPKSYHFIGNREQKVKQIGNAVPVGMAAALCRSILKARAGVQNYTEEKAA